MIQILFIFTIVSLFLAVVLLLWECVQFSDDFFLQYFPGYGYHGTSFEQTYRCYPASFIEKVVMQFVNTLDFTSA